MSAFFAAIDNSFHSTVVPTNRQAFDRTIESAFNAAFDATF